MLQRVRALGGFLIINTLLALFLVSRYYQQLPSAPDGSLEWGFLALSTFSHTALLVLLVGTLSLPLVMLPKRLWMVLVAGAAAFLQTLLLVDTLVFAQYKFHINGAILDLVFAGQVVDFPLSTWLLVISAIVALWLLQTLLLGWLTNRAPGKKHGFAPFVGVTLLTFVLASLIHIWAAAHAYQPITSLKRYLPGYYPVTANSFMKKQGWINEEELARQKALSQKRTGTLQYPLAPLETTPVTNPTNIVLIVIDSWRYDTMNPDNTPQIWQIAQQGVVFDKHWSAGNSTRTGLFGLFYGLPGTYWQEFLNGQTPPALVNRLQQLDYQIGVFASAQLRTPEFNRTIFAHIDNLREDSQGTTPSERDRDLLEDWKHWQQHKSTDRPAFSFLFFDAPHGYDFPKDFEPAYLPQVDKIDYINLNNKTDPEPIFNRYKNSVLFIDGLVGEVIAELKQAGELDNTLLIITGDHGQEMNDTRLNYWGHNSNFTRHQVQVPFIIAGPGTRQLSAPSVMTSHVDIPPTLLKHYLGVLNDVHDYSTGYNLFELPDERPWVMAASYSMFAILTDDRIFEVDPLGQSQLLNADNQYVTNEKFDAHYLQDVIRSMSQFLR